VLIGCRITGGRINKDGNTDDAGYMDITKGTGGGQVGASCGCIGCYDDFDHIQGQWQYSRKGQGNGKKNLGTFHASDFNSLMCLCLDEQGNPTDQTNGLCNPGDREAGPEPRKAPANAACFTGIGTLSPPQLGKKTEVVAFRVHVEDRGEPGAGSNAGNLDDLYHIEIWIPNRNPVTGDPEDLGETAEDLALQACCFAEQTTTMRTPNIDDGGPAGDPDGDLVHGNIQIHPETPNTEKDVCAPPPHSGSLCTDRILP
jgi:hypothetical protein